MKNFLKNKCVFLKLAIQLTVVFSTFAFAAVDSSCNNSSALNLALEGKNRYEKWIKTIPGAYKIEVGTCSDLESYGATENSWKCGVYVFFTSEGARTVFHQTTGLWGGRLLLPGGASTAICSRTSPQIKK